MTRLHQGALLIGGIAMALFWAAGRGPHGVATGAPAAERARVPASRGGRDMLGKPLPLDGLRWLNTPDAKPPALQGKVTLVRWWTETCPFCRRSLPAIETLRKDFGKRGFQAIAVYHPKPPRPVAGTDILRAAKAFGYRGSVAADLEWKTLQRAYLSTGRRTATSVSFLLDRRGIVRFVHPGPEFRPTSNPREKRLNQDYQDIRTAIEALLREPGK